MMLQISTETPKNQLRSVTGSNETGAPTSLPQECFTTQRDSTSSESTTAEQSPIKSHKNKTSQHNFTYDSDLVKLCEDFLVSKNYQGLALLARQKGLPPFLRFKIWPILLKYHPFVLKPYLQPDTVNAEEDFGDSSEEHPSEEDISDKEKRLEKQKLKKKIKTEMRLEYKVKKDLEKYIKRLNFKNEKSLNDIEQGIFNVLEASILRFVRKWGKVVRYDSAMTWIALGLAEWVPPLSHSPYVLIGREAPKQEVCIKNLFDDYTEFISQHGTLGDLIAKELNSENSLSFQEIYERLVLVLLHSPEEEKETYSKTTLPIKGGTIEERVSFFIYAFRNLLPELAQFFSEEQILNKFGSNDDEWLIWWLKWCGSKAWSRNDRGCLWDMLLGWKRYNPRKDLKMNLNLSSEILSKIGPDVFWSPLANDKVQSYESLIHPPQLGRNDSLKSLINSLTLTKVDENQGGTYNTTEEYNKLEIPFSRLDPHFELIFIALAVLKNKEIDLLELEQNEIRQYLSKVPTKNYGHHQHHHHHHHLLSNQLGSTSNQTLEHNGDQTDKSSNGFSVSGDDSNSSTSYNTANSSVSTINVPVKMNNISYMGHIMNEAGDLWRKWLWQEMQENE